MEIEPGVDRDAIAARRAGKEKSGPREQYDQWRSLRTHSVENIMSAYKELFFAGFPRRIKEGPNGTRTIDESVVPFPQSFVYDFFQKYGVIENFAYDADRGMGSVTFADGEAGEGCYLCAHLSLVYPPPELMRRGDEDGERKRNWQPPKPILVVLEFAQALAFVNTALLLHEELQPGDMSRHLLRTFPRIERKFTATAAEQVVMEWLEEAPKTEEKEEGGDGENAEAGATPKRKAVGPTFPGGEIEVPELRQSLWRTLRPPGLKAEAGTRVTVLDLWFEYYVQYHVNKTQPSPDRIAAPLFCFAQRPSVVQEIATLDPQDPAESGRGFNIAHRLTHDSAYHQICTLLCYKIKFKNDPSWASFMRDIFTPAVQTAIDANLAKRTYAADRHLMDLQKSLMSSLQRSGSEDEWLALPLTTAALNAMENVKLLRRIDMGEIDRKTGQDLPPEELRRLREKNKFRTAALDDAYIIFSDFANYVDTYAASGAASALLTICEDPRKFREEKGHSGYSAIFESPSLLRALWEMFWIPIVVMVGLMSLILGLNYGIRP